MPEKIRFVSWEVLKEHLPVFICPPPKTEEQLDGLLDLIEEDLILKKAKEIQEKRAGGSSGSS